MILDAARGRALIAPRQGEMMRSALLCWAVLACLAPRPAMARDLGPFEPDLPCNDLCRSWMAWHPGHGTATDGQPGSSIGGAGEAARFVGGMVAGPPRTPASVRAGRVIRPKRLEAQGPARDEDASVSRKTSSPPRVVPSQRSSALVSTPAEPVEAAAGGGSPLSGRAAVHVDPPREGDADRLRSDSADAAVLARPLYQPPDVGDVPRDRPETSDGPNSRETEPQVPDHAMSRAEARRDDRDAADTPRIPPLIGSEPRGAPPAVALPAVDQPPPATAAAGAPSSAARPESDVPVGAARGRTVPVRAVPVPALPASDLERLDEANVLELPIAVAASTKPVTPTLGVALLGGFAVLSLVGVRRRQPASGPT